jgi:hypothetical protein
MLTIRTLATVAGVGCELAFTYAADLEPVIPAHPAALKECTKWVEDLKQYWERKVVVSARQTDAYCKKVAAEPNKIVESLCGNVSAKVKHEHCDEAKKFTDCAAVQAERGFEICKQRLGPTARSDTPSSSKPSAPISDAPKNQATESVKPDTCLDTRQACVTSCINAGNELLQCKSCYNDPGTQAGRFCYLGPPK